MPSERSRRALEDRRVLRDERETDGVLQMSRIYADRTTLYSRQSTDIRAMFELRVLVGSCRYPQVFSQSHCQRAETI